MTDEKEEDKTISISKQDVWGKEVEGAKLTLTSDDEEFEAITWTSGKEPKIIKNLPDGTYTLKETEVPNGYKKAQDITFEIKDGKLVGEEEQVVMVDETEIEFSKQSVNDTKELPGAVIEITAVDEDGKDVKFDENVKSDSKSVVKTDNKITWTSGEEVTKINNLPDGKYTMKEITAPDGYTLKEESVEFEIKDGKLVNSEDNKVVMKDESAVLNISKVDVGGKELPGAKLTLTGKSDGKDITFDVTKVKIGENGELISKENTTSLEWVSGNKPTEITNIPDGEYTLHEVAAPDGYEKAEDITFKVENGVITEIDSKKLDKSVNTVAMTDKAKTTTTATTEDTTTTKSTTNTTTITTTKETSTTKETTITTESTTATTEDTTTTKSTTVSTTKETSTTEKTTTTTESTTVTTESTTTETTTTTTTTETTTTTTETTTTTTTTETTTTTTE
ncbi:MAG: SpaA isopeptide-forming pilin-related protein, partial [Muribaculaceae bacterium]|nr:SpaA isopeptide-forming pilin-related protein [Muribaculaceae bacterium]